MRRFVPCVGLLLLACGQTQHDPEDGAGATSSAGNASGGNASAGSHASGGKAPGGGRAGTSSMGGVGQGGVAQGGRPDPGDGGAPDRPDLLDCSMPYDGPMAGARVDGPPLLMGCENLDDAMVLSRYKDYGARVPQGLFYEDPVQLVTWGPGCSDSSEETIDYAGHDRGALVAEYTTPWFYEVEFCQGGARYLYRQLNCDYFDGETFSSSDLDEFAFLASLLWWQQNSNLGGSAILGYGAAIGNATDWLELCTIQTVGGDFGLCDEVTLFSTTHLLMYDRRVTLGTPQVVRTVQGDCH